MADLPTTVNVVEPVITEAPEDFFTICPRDSKFGEYNIQPVKLKVVQTKGVDVTPQVNIKVNEFNEGFNQFVNNSGDGDRFKIEIIINRNETVTGNQHINYHNNGIDQSSVAGLIADIISDGIQENEVNLFLPTEDEDMDYYMYDYNPLTYVLNYWIKTATPLYVVTQAIDVPNGEYIIVDNNSRKQNYHEHTIWTLEFVKYNVLKLGTFKNTDKVVNDAIKSYNNKKNKKASKTTAKAKETVSQTNSLKKKMKKCNYKVLKFSKKKKVVECVKTMQRLLNHYTGSKLKIDGWFSTETKKAVIQFQIKYKVKYKLKTNGKVNKATWKALYTGGTSAVQVGKTINIPATNLPTGIIKSS